METKILPILAIEIFEKVKNIKSSHINNLFFSKTSAKVHSNGIVVRCHKTNNYGDKCIGVIVLGPKIWN